MKLFLASQASETLDLLIPYLAKKPQDMRVAFITTASNLYPDHPWLDHDLAKLHELGFHVNCLDIAQMTPDQVSSELQNIDIIFVAGGNTSYLLEQSHISGFFKIVKELVAHDVWYVGSSAGSVIAGPDIEYDKLYDDGEFGKILDSYTGLNFIDFIPVPHADSKLHQPYIEKSLKEYGTKWDMRKITDQQAYLVIDGIVTIIQT